MGVMGCRSAAFPGATMAMVFGVLTRGQWQTAHASPCNVSDHCGLCAQILALGQGGEWQRALSTFQGLRMQRSLALGSSGELPEALGPRTWSAIIAACYGKLLHLPESQLGSLFGRYTSTCQPKPLDGIDKSTRAVEPLFDVSSCGAR